MPEIDSQKIKEILTRGVAKVIKYEHLEERIKRGDKLRVKFGIDPTAPELHLGHAVVLRKLRQFQDLGHQVIFLIGDFTAKIGDPSGRNATRPPLSDKEIKQNMKLYVKQASKILNVKKLKVRYNSEWYSKKNPAFFMDLLTRFTVARVLERDEFQRRLKENRDISVSEIIYPLLQGYDSVMLKADLEVGGADQEFNILMGRHAQKKYDQPEQDVLTVPLLEGADGKRKMSKSYGNVINLTDEPNQMFGQIMAIPDSLLEKYFELLTDLSLDEIRQLKTLNPRDAKARLGRVMVAFYYSPRAAQKAEQEFERVFKEKKQPSKIIECRLLAGDYPILEFLVQTKMAPSKSEAQRLIEQGGVRINNQKQADWRKIISFEDEMIIQIGKRKFVRVRKK